MKKTHFTPEEIGTPLSEAADRIPSLVSPRENPGLRWKILKGTALRVTTEPPDPVARHQKKLMNNVSARQQAGQDPLDGVLILSHRSLSRLLTLPWFLVLMAMVCASIATELAFTLAHQPAKYRLFRFVATEVNLETDQVVEEPHVQGFDLLRDGCRLDLSGEWEVLNHTIIREFPRGIRPNGWTVYRTGYDGTSFADLTNPGGEVSDTNDAELGSDSEPEEGEEVMEATSFVLQGSNDGRGWEDVAAATWRHNSYLEAVPLEAGLSPEEDAPTGVYDLDFRAPAGLAVFRVAGRAVRLACLALALGCVLWGKGKVAQVLVVLSFLFHAAAGLVACLLLATDARASPSLAFLPSIHAAHDLVMFTALAGAQRMLVQAAVLGGVLPIATVVEVGALRGDSLKDLAWELPWSGVALFLIGGVGLWQQQRLRASARARIQSDMQRYEEAWEAWVGGMSAEERAGLQRARQLTGAAAACLPRSNPVHLLPRSALLPLADAGAGAWSWRRVVRRWFDGCWRGGDAGDGRSGAAVESVKMGVLTMGRAGRRGSGAAGEEEVVAVGDLDQVRHMAEAVAPALRRKVWEWAQESGAMLPAAEDAREEGGEARAGRGRLSKRPSWSASGVAELFGAAASSGAAGAGAGGAQRWVAAGTLGEEREVEWAGLKGVERTIDKGERVYGKRGGRVVDVCRQRVAVQGPGDLLRMLRCVLLDPDVSVRRIKDRMRDREAKRNSAGFRSVVINLNLLLPEVFPACLHVCELQIVPLPIVQAQALADHAAYLLFRNARGMPSLPRLAHRLIRRRREPQQQLDVFGSFGRSGRAVRDVTVQAGSVKEGGAQRRWLGRWRVAAEEQSREPEGGQEVEVVGVSWFDSTRPAAPVQGGEGRFLGDGEAGKGEAEARRRSSLVGDGGAAGVGEAEGDEEVQRAVEQRLRAERAEGVKGMLWRKRAEWEGEGGGGAPASAGSLEEALGRVLCMVVSSEGAALDRRVKASARSVMAEASLASAFFSSMPVAAAVGFRSVRLAMLAAALLLVLGVLQPLHAHLRAAMGAQRLTHLRISAVETAGRVPPSHPGVLYANLMLGGCESHRVADAERSVEGGDVVLSYARAERSNGWMLIRNASGGPEEVSAWAVFGRRPGGDDWECLVPAWLQREQGGECRVAAGSEALAAAEYQGQREALRGREVLQMDLRPQLAAVVWVSSPLLHAAGLVAAVVAAGLGRERLAWRGMAAGNGAAGVLLVGAAAALHPSEEGGRLWGWWLGHGLGHALLSLGLALAQGQWVALEGALSAGAALVVGVVYLRHARAWWVVAAGVIGEAGVAVACGVVLGMRLWVLRRSAQLIGEDKAAYDRIWEELLEGEGERGRLEQLQEVVKSTQRGEAGRTPRQCLPPAGGGEQGGDDAGASFEVRAVRSLDQIFLQAEIMHSVLLGKVKEWACCSGGMVRRNGGGFVAWREVKGDPAKEAECKWGAVKKSGRAIEKLLRSYGADPSKLVDVCRQTLVFNTIQDLQACLAAIRDDGDVKVLRVKNRMNPSYDSTLSAGYRDVALNLQISTPTTTELAVHHHICEMQLIYIRFAMLKSDQGHARYVKFRNARAE